MNQPVEFVYSNHNLLYTSQFIAAAGEEEVILDCGAAVVAAGSEGSADQLPIHTRLALPWSAAERLHSLLGQLLRSRPAEPNQGRASLPPLAFDATSTSEGSSV